MSNNNFYTPEQIRPYYDAIIPTYQTAFAGEPWFEVSKCVGGLQQKCAGGLSSVAIGQSCLPCGNRPARPAYESSELVSRFEATAATRPADWYLETTNGNVALAATAWKASASEITKLKYDNSNQMGKWLFDQLGSQPIAWLDEVFANQTVRNKGNLRRFGSMCLGFIERLDTDTLAFRTINEYMVAAATRDFGDRAEVYTRNTEVPDWRDVVIIRKGEI